MCCAYSNHRTHDTEYTFKQMPYNTQYFSVSNLQYIVFGMPYVKCNLQYVVCNK